ncbi:hypothetical protein, partial [Lysobacter antibioticus]|uniref:hypothetical protein n=1 Tax=Lysobacter antibioticus TaxID=84531 RepID=UPI001C989582
RNQFGRFKTIDPGRRRRNALASDHRLWTDACQEEGELDLPRVAHSDPRVGPSVSGDTAGYASSKRARRSTMKFTITGKVRR